MCFVIVMVRKVRCPHKTERVYEVTYCAMALVLNSLVLQRMYRLNDVLFLIGYVINSPVSLTQLLVI